MSANLILVLASCFVGGMVAGFAMVTAGFWFADRSRKEMG